MYSSEWHRITLLEAYTHIACRHRGTAIAFRVQVSVKTFIYMFCRFVPIVK